MKESAMERQEGGIGMNYGRGDKKRIRKKLGSLLFMEPAVRIELTTY